jgi:hypothetical protein
MFHSEVQVWCERFSPRFDGTVRFRQERGVTGMLKLGKWLARCYAALAIGG